MKNMNEQGINLILQEYKAKIALYNDFCVTMQQLLMRLLANSGFKFQIASRIKSEDSLKKKIIKKTETKMPVKKLEDVNDLAGIRIVFLLESEKNKFITELYKEFTPHKLKLLERHKEKGYRATHIIAKFGRKRAGLGEYKRYNNLKCEIQLTSALYHVWSEIEHDIFYKPDFSDRPQKRGELIKLKKDLENILTQYIQKASVKLESIVERIKLIKKLDSNRIEKMNS
jgi:ppGpp synthetase/RelA/SpoT-type nucleotidyltranferase